MRFDVKIFKAAKIQANIMINQMKIKIFISESFLPAWHAILATVHPASGPPVRASQNRLPLGNSSHYLLSREVRCPWQITDFLASHQVFFVLGPGNLVPFVLHILPE